MAQHVQPTFDGASIRWFSISAAHRWPTGWTGSLTVAQEGEDAPVTMITFTELTSMQLCAALAIAMEQVVVLLGGPD